MRSDLYRDPKVCMIADHLLDDHGELFHHVNQNCQRDMTVTRNVIRNATVGALVSVWGVFRLRGKPVDGGLSVTGATLAVIDDVADLPGLGQAMASVGWAIEDAQGVVFPRFFEDYNVDPASDLKSQNAERQRRFRERQKANADNAQVTLQRNAREEKRREEKNSASQSRGDQPKPAKKPPKEFALTPAMRAWAKESAPTVDDVAETQKFMDHTFKTAMTDWHGAWRNWMRNAATYAAERAPRNGAKPHMSTEERNAEARRLLGFDQPPKGTQEVFDA